MAETSLLKTRLLKPHVKTCWFVTGQTDQHPWIVDAYEGLRHVRRDAIGRSGRGTWYWIPFRCNDPQCPASGIIRLDSIELQIPEQP